MLSQALPGFPQGLKALNCEISFWYLEEVVNLVKMYMR